MPRSRISVVVVQAQADVQTPYAGGVAMAERLGNRLITVTSTECFRRGLCRTTKALVT